MLFCDRAVRAYYEENHVLRFGVRITYAIVPPNVSPVVIELKSQGRSVRRSTILKPISRRQHLP